jgi:3-oxoacyl-[acyl-carrier-protein] synthase II
MAARRVVVTGLGVVSPLGVGVEATWSRLLAGASGAGPITLFDASEFPVRFACEADAFAPAAEDAGLDRFVQLAIAAGRMAVESADLDVRAEPDRVGVSLAAGQGGLLTLSATYGALRDGGPDAVGPTALPTIFPDAAATTTAARLGVGGPVLTECTACAASAMSIGDGLNAIRAGRADVMLAGGSEAAISDVGIAGFAATRALSRRNDDPQRASRPFDVDRDGFVAGEGAAVLVLEELEHALARGATIHAELAGYGATADAFHITEPDPTGAGQLRAMRLALGEAGVDASALDHVNAHATSTPVGDAAEARVFSRLLNGRRAAVSATKGATGHCLGAAGALEAAFTVLAVRDDLAPPTINFERADDEFDLDLVANDPREQRIDVALTTNYGFGGHNAALVFRKAPR